MPNVEIDEAELLANRQVVAAVNQMMGNPKSRQLLLHARKTADPSASVPEVDAMAPVAGALDNFRKELAEERKARAEEREAEATQRRLEQATREVEGVKSRLRAAGWTADGIAAVEKMAEERGTFDLEATAALHEKLNPPPPPAEPNGMGSWGFFEGADQEGGDKFVKSMLESGGDDEGALSREIQAALRDHRNGVNAR